MFPHSVSPDPSGSKPSLTEKSCGRRYESFFFSRCAHQPTISAVYFPVKKTADQPTLQRAKACQVGKTVGDEDSTWVMFVTVTACRHGRHAC